jgi:hypothetical protein
VPSFPDSPEEFVRQMLAGLGDEARSIVCEPEPEGGWYCTAELVGGGVWGGRVGAGTVIWDDDR